MLLGKRPRLPMKRTTSMNEITFDLGETTPASQPSDHNKNNPFNATNRQKQGCGGGGDGGLEGLDQRFLSTVSPRSNHRRHSTDFQDTTHFLRACCLCKRKLVPGRDIYMYRYFCRGDSAFCSSECRQQQMNQDERKEKFSVVSSNKKAASPAAAKGETVAAAV
ncbi:hypothetical protein Dsin_002706 [Dipteronia sinensis]|uniref:FLZ-type domain-containing protein n=1 Tax=Dipteronia sinensis TaxID=43782 RepID=A0AAE0B7Q0_9ROSI|nr:hypothetical protein Dsin_002706 [Dipteronia sinensis]